MARRQGYKVIFGGEQNLGTWLQLFADDDARVERWTVTRQVLAADAFPRASRGRVLPLLVRRSQAVVVVDDDLQLAPGDVVEVALTREPGDAADQEAVRSFLATPEAGASRRGGTA